MLQITGKTCLTGLLGSPVDHSISPLMHNFSFEALGMNWVYLCFDVKEDRLEAAVQGLRALQVKGFNLTMPNKNKVLDYLDELSPAARLIGAVNTVENRDGCLIGHNTDGIGFMQSVKEQGIQMQGETMTLLGMGGAGSSGSGGNHSYFCAVRKQTPFQNGRASEGVGKRNCLYH